MDEIIEIADDKSTDVQLAHRRTEARKWIIDYLLKKRKAWRADRSDAEADAERYGKIAYQVVMR